MTLTDILQGLRIETVRHGKTYQAGRARQAALAPYPTASAALLALEVASPATAGERDAITVAFIAEQQAAPHPLWQSLLLQAFAPMLRSRIKQLPLGEEFEQRVVVAFLEAITRLSTDDPPAYVALSLKRAVAERVYDPLRRERREESLVVAFDDEIARSPGDVLTAATQLADLVDVARALKAEPDGAAACDMLVATVVHEEPLFGYVERTSGDATRTEVWRAYRRIRKDRDRLLATLRAELGDEEEKVEERAQESEAPIPLMGWEESAA